jgi:all-trans-8'-apo-beta-carotenal 15,15'-oxygenase
MSSDVPGVVVDEWSPGPRSFCGEAMVVPKGAGASDGTGSEDDAWVLVGVHNAESGTADIAILDGGRLSAGPVAVIHLPHHLPASFHGSFTHEYLGPDPGDASVPVWAPPTTYRAMQ